MGGDAWTEEDKTREAAYLALHAIDWGQTRYIATHPDQFYEINPLLGEHPTTRRVDRYMLMSGTLHFVITDYLSASNRERFQYLTLGLKASLVAYNFSVGIKIDF